MHQDIRAVLQINIESPYWEEGLSRALNDPEIPQWLTDDYLHALEKDYNLLGDQFPAVAEALHQVRETEALCLLAKILYHIIHINHSRAQAFPTFQLPQAPAGVPTLGYDFVGIFPLLGHVRPACQLLADRGVDETIQYDTLEFFRINLQLSCENAGRPYFSEYAFSIYNAYIYTYYLYIGRLRFEWYPNSNRNVKGFADKNGNVCLLMHEITLHKSGAILGAVGCTDEDGAFDAAFIETDDYYEGYAVNPETGLAENTRIRLPKRDWQCILQPGDDLLKVHIPPGKKLLKEDCDAAYNKAREVFRKCYPEYDFKGFVCNTWFLCPALATFLKQDSNIVRFQEAYHIFPAKNNAADVFWYVYKQRVSSATEVDASALPEGNTMQRGVKQLLLDGKYVHEYNGFIPF